MSIGNQSPKHVLDVADELEKKVQDLPKVGWKDADWLTASEQRQKAADQLAEELRTRNNNRATISRATDGTWRISMLGLRASCTGSLCGAFDNWIAQARRKAHAAKKKQTS